VENIPSLSGTAYGLDSGPVLGRGAEVGDAGVSVLGILENNLPNHQLRSRFHGRNSQWVG
jgi:hypothetical protein